MKLPLFPTALTVCALAAAARRARVTAGHGRRGFDGALPGAPVP